MTIELIVDGTIVHIKKELSLNPFNPIEPEEGICLPEKMEKGKFYKFLINGYALFPLGKTIPLLIKDENASKPLANINITEQTTFLLGGYIRTRGEYLVTGVYKY